MNRVYIEYVYESDLASTKQLLEALVEGEDGIIREQHTMLVEDDTPELRTMTVSFPTAWKACWFIAKLTSHLDFVWFVKFDFSGTRKDLKGD